MPDRPAPVLSLDEARERRREAEEARLERLVRARWTGPVDDETCDDDPNPAR